MYSDDHAESKAKGNAPRLERALSDARPEAAETPAALGAFHKELVLTVAELRERVVELEAENGRFADKYIQVQEQNAAIMSLYVASQRLHATLEPDEVMAIVSEILIEMVGAERFGFFLVNERSNELELIIDEGVSGRLGSRTVSSRDGILAEITRSGRAFFASGTETPDAGAPIAAIPITIESHTLGLLAIYELLGHKSALTAVDHQILDLLGAHAATALVSARLHKTMNRKLETIEGFMNLIKR